MTTELFFSVRIHGVPQMHHTLGAHFEGQKAAWHRTGEPMDGRFARAGDETWPNDIFILGSPPNLGTDLVKHLEWVCQILQENRAIFSNARAAGGSIDVYCGYMMATGVTSFGVKSRHIAIFDEFGIDMFFRIVAIPPPEKL